MGGSVRLSPHPPCARFVLTSRPFYNGMRADSERLGMSRRNPRVLILGGGFGGMYAALEFERALARGADLEVTLVNRDNFFLFTPMLHEVAASDLDITHIVSPIRALLRRTRVVCGDVIGID